MSDSLSQINTHGFAVHDWIVGDDACAALCEGLAGRTSAHRRDGTYALRNVLELEAVADLARCAAVRDLVEPVLGSDARAVRGIFFDKVPGANWHVPWHQDRSIAVRERVEVPGYGPWSVKDGVVHVQPPAEVLENMVTVRIHLDPCPTENGALQVLPGTHRLGIIPGEILRDIHTRYATETCAVPQGGVLVMRPLLVHASRASDLPAHRRVVHIEFAAGELPGGLAWHEVV
jgi:ectoine hydroxylase-related dioxygenase (phytanoyl-CoA dioxygenase family)